MIKMILVITTVYGDNNKTQDYGKYKGKQNLDGTTLLMMQNYRGDIGD